MKIFEGEMYIISLPTTLIQIFYKYVLNFQVIIKSFNDPDDNFKSKYSALMG